ncbi:MAG: ROK family protein [Anaerolineae bacterium]|nr:ROK family protein [Anaerolineae bacterium]
MDLFGGIESGGTKFVCAIGTATGEIKEEIRYPTTTPDESISRAIAFFQKAATQGRTLKAIGVSSFGPLDPHPTSPKFGYVTTTPKPGWMNTDFVGRLHTTFPDLPVGFDTDVNGAALGEYRWGVAQGLDTFIYLTIGTGIGGGAIVNGKPVHGLMHPEMGHVRVPHDLAADPFPGMCPYHGDCLEGLACGPAIEARWQQRGETLAPDHPAWALEAHYLALGIVNFIVTLSPQRIIMGGGVMDQHHIFPLIHQEVGSLLNAYIHAPQILEHIEDYVVPPGLGNQAGVLGAIALAQTALTIG